MHCRNLSELNIILKRMKETNRNFVNNIMIEIPLKMMKNVFYFILKALFVLKIFKFLSWHSRHVEKNGSIRKIMLISKSMTSQPG